MSFDGKVLYIGEKKELTEDEMKSWTEWETYMKNLGRLRGCYQLVENSFRETIRKTAVKLAKKELKKAVLTIEELKNLRNYCFDDDEVVDMVEVRLKLMEKQGNISSSLMSAIG